MDDEIFINAGMIIGKLMRYSVEDYLQASNLGNLRPEYRALMMRLAVFRKECSEPLGNEMYSPPVSRQIDLPD